MREHRDQIALEKSRKGAIGHVPLCRGSGFVVCGECGELILKSAPAELVDERWLHVECATSFAMGLRA